jgi:putative membrane protein
VLLVAALVLLVVSGIGPHDRGTWLLEVFPVTIAAPLLVFTYRAFPLTPLAYRLIFLHACILMLGGHYTYAETPLGFWLKDLFDLSRNPYDRIGHIAQGFVPAILVREILVRRSPLRPGRWLQFITSCIVLAISACYEFLEWWAALALGSGADEFLATQGDQWDTQWDMFLALLGGIASQLLLGRMHDRQLATLGPLKRANMPAGTFLPRA